MRPVLPRKFAYYQCHPTLIEWDALKHAFEPAIQYLCQLTRQPKGISFTEPIYNCVHIESSAYSYPNANVAPFSPRQARSFLL